MDKWKKASFTVEAALLVPMLVYLLIAVLYVDFWLFDRTVANGICCQAAWQLHTAEDSDEEDMKVRLEEALNRGLLCGRVSEADCSANDIYTRADCTVTMEIPLPGVRWILGNTTGYQAEHTSVVSGLGSMTVFRKLCAAEKTETAKE